VLRNFLVLSLISILLSACSASSHLIIGEVRSPINMTEVKIYTEKPEVFEKIAIIDASSKNSFAFTEQGKMDAALELLKQEAAKLGANGILLRSVNDDQVLVPITNTDGSTTYATGTNKSLKATAIYVKGL
jgi:hypothetical protein